MPCRATGLSAILIGGAGSLSESWSLSLPVVEGQLECYGGRRSWADRGARKGSMKSKCKPLSALRLRANILKGTEGSEMIDTEIVAAYLGFHVAHDAHLLPSFEGLLCYRTSAI